jgi:hypothetical protein
LGEEQSLPSSRYHSGDRSTHSNGRPDVSEHVHAPERLQQRESSFYQSPEWSSPDYVHPFFESPEYRNYSWLGELEGPFARYEHLLRPVSKSTYNNSSLRHRYKCDWQRCRAIFDNLYELRLHSQQLHNRYIHCMELFCGASFTEQRSLDRHVANIHQARRSSFCPYPGCPYSDEGFTRQESLQKHLRRKRAGHGSGSITESQA